MNSISNFQVSRIGNLIRYEWMNRRKMYVAATLGMLLFLTLFFFYIIYANYNTIYVLSRNIISDSKGLVWGSENYKPVFYVGFIFLAVFFIGQSFLDLRDKGKARLYFLLPASQFEKFVVEFLLKVFLPLVTYPIIFWLSSIFSVELFKVFSSNFLNPFNNELPESVEFLSLFQLPDEQISPIYWLIGGLLCLFPSLMFSGGVFFGKWNSLLMPLTIIAIWGIMTLSSLVLSWLIHPVTVSRNGGQARIEIFNFDQPEIFSNTPLTVFVIVFCLWAAVFISYLASYYKLTEKEV